MSPGIGMPELLVVLVLALVVVGPRQLPVMMRKVGQIMNQARAMAKEFQHSFDEIGRETELSELRKEIEALKKGNPVEEIRGELDKAAFEAGHGGGAVQESKPVGSETGKAASLPHRGGE
jgi:sec-independent protein translocase protein TatB